jgi:hypothetical protein
MEINNDDRRFAPKVSQQGVHDPEGTIIIFHEGAAYQTDHYRTSFGQITSSRHTRGIIQRAQDGHITVKVGQNIFLGPDMITRGQYVNPAIEQFSGCTRSHSQTAGHVLRVGYDQVQVILAAQLR